MTALTPIDSTRIERKSLVPSIVLCNFKKPCKVSALATTIFIAMIALPVFVSSGSGIAFGYMVIITASTLSFLHLFRQKQPQQISNITQPIFTIPTSPSSAPAISAKPIISKPSALQLEAADKELEMKKQVEKELSALEGEKKVSVDTLSFLLAEPYNVNPIKQVFLTQMHSQFGIIFTRWFSTFLAHFNLPPSTSYTLKDNVFTLTQKETQKTEVTWFKGNPKDTRTVLSTQNIIIFTFKNFSVEVSGISISSGKKTMGITTSATAELTAISFYPTDNSFSLERSAVKFLESLVASGIRDGCLTNKNIDFIPSENTRVFRFLRPDPKAPVPSPIWKC